MSILMIFTISLDVCVLLVSTSGHMFILLVNALDAAKSRRLHLGDRLICNISVVNILFLNLNIFEDIFFFLRPINISIEAANKCFLVLYLTMHSSNIWFSTWLCVYFCVTIVKINQRFYIYLQKIFPKVVTWICIFTVLQSIIFSFFSVRTNSAELSSNSTDTVYDVIESLRMYYMYTPHIYIYSVTFSASFIISYASALTVIFFLFKHMKKMKHNSEVPRNTPNVEAHIRAIRTILALLAINTLLFLSALHWFTMNSITNYQHFTIIFSALHSLLLPLVLIKLNSKLNKILQKFLQNWTFSE
ncbi:hypothetical protein GDO78_019055 [Eleutherodactylus coqui]|uniref:Taste receptor type 2 n=1 Tax=Eleutherodactylus coqui TaxID=57060 RepID=A0A8J6B532_ELECQ|nr:hypothetical protein GDO78_019055 [Eleutherodactylus coqui]